MIERQIDRPMPSPSGLLVMNGSKSDLRLKNAARAIAETIPGAQHRELPGQTHNVKPDALTPAVVEFLAAPAAARARS